MAGRHDSLDMTDNLPKGRRPRINTLVLQDMGFCNSLVSCSYRKSVTRNSQRLKCCSLKMERNGLTGSALSDDDDDGGDVIRSP